MSFHHLDHFTQVAAVLVGIVSVARTARLLTFDEFPPATWLRVRWVALFKDGSPWAKLATCPFCLSPYLAVGMFAWAWASSLDSWWWVVNGIWAGSYAAAILVSYDEGVT